MQAPAHFPPDKDHQSPAKSSVILLGASVRSAAQSAAVAGFRVIGIDEFADQDSRDACEQFYRLGHQEDLGAILRSHPEAPVVQVGGLTRAFPALQQPSPFGSAIYPPPEVSATLADPGVLRRMATDCGFQFPVTIGPHALEVGYLPNPLIRWLRKPTGGSGGIGIQWCEAATETPAQGEVFQHWIAGKNFGATLLLDASGPHLLGLCRSTFHRLKSRSKTQTSLFPFVYSGSLGPLGCPPAWRDSLLKLGREIASRTKLRGMCNVDFIVDADGNRWLLEVNPRWSGSSELVERGLREQGWLNASAPSLFSIAWASMRGEAIADLPEDLSARAGGQGFSCYRKRILFAGKKLNFKPNRVTKFLDDGSELRDVPCDGSTVLAGQPICSLIVSIGANEKRPMRRVRRLTRTLRDALTGSRAATRG